MGSFGTGVDGQTADPTRSESYLLALIVGALQSFTGGGTGGGGSVGIVTTQQTVNNHTSVLVPQSTSQTIPAGAKGWTVSILTGTATVNGAAGMAAGFSDSDIYTTTNAFTVVTDAASTAYVRWNT